MAKRISELRASPILRVKLLKLLQVLEGRVAEEDEGEIFCSEAIGAINFLGALSIEVQESEMENIPNYGMSLLSLHLNKPEQASYWHKLDKKSALNENSEIGEDELNHLLDQYQQYRNLWTSMEGL